VLWRRVARSARFELLCEGVAGRRQHHQRAALTEAFWVGLELLGRRSIQSIFLVLLERIWTCSPLQQSMGASGNRTRIPVSRTRYMAVTIPALR
jgi:hypothetical protein